MAGFEVLWAVVFGFCPLPPIPRGLPERFGAVRRKAMRSSKETDSEAGRTEKTQDGEQVLPSKKRISGSAWGLDHGSCDAGAPVSFACGEVGPSAAWCFST